MQPYLEGLLQQHQWIEQVLQACQRPSSKGEALLSLLKEKLLPIHQEEEDRLFQWLVQKGYPGDRGPLKMMAEDHQKIREGLENLDRSWMDLLFQHFDRETTVLFPEIDSREILPKAWQATIFDPLVLPFLKKENNLLSRPQAMGCAACSYYGESCQGIEQEWWNELEWEEFHLRND